MGRKIILRKGYAVSVHELSSGGFLIVLHLANRTVFYDIDSNYVNRKVYSDEGFKLIKNKTHYSNKSKEIFLQSLEKVWKL